MINTSTEPRWHKESYECSETIISLFFQRRTTCYLKWKQPLIGPNQDPLVSYIILLVRLHTSSIVNRLRSRRGRCRQRNRRRAHWLEDRRWSKKRQTSRRPVLLLAYGKCKNLHGEITLKIHFAINSKLSQTQIKNDSYILVDKSKEIDMKIFLDVFLTPFPISITFVCLFSTRLSIPQRHDVT